MTVNAYFAGPLFTHAERAWNLAVVETLRVVRPEIEVFLPQIETEPAFRVSPPNFAEVQRICLRGIDRSDVVIAILDGADADSGTCFECGYAYAKGHPVVGVRTDMRAGEDEGINAMLTRSCAAIVHTKVSDDLTSVAEQIATAVMSAAGRTRA